MRSHRRSWASMRATAGWRRPVPTDAKRDGEANSCRPWCTMSPLRRRAMDVIRYEHPLNERIRTLMRLVDLYVRALFVSGETAPADSHVALLALLEVDYADRLAPLYTAYQE